MADQLDHQEGVTMKFYITKYALTKGIIEIDAENMRNIQVKEGRLYFFNRENIYYAYSLGEWYMDKAYAVIDAESRKRKKITSLQKQIARLEQLTFSIDAENDLGQEKGGYSDD